MIRSICIHYSSELQVKGAVGIIGHSGPHELRPGLWHTGEKLEGLPTAVQICFRGPPRHSSLGLFIPMKHMMS